MFWSSAAQVASKMESLRNAEAKLMTLARRFGERDPSSYDMDVFDTSIPRSTVPLKDSWSVSCEKDDTDELIIHGVRVTSKDNSSSQQSTETPLVLQHGYMNGGLYFFRNLVGLCNYFRNVYAIDMLGWGLSSRPAYKLKDASVETTEEFFVESLEAWRKQNNIEKMVLAGHSMGGYLSVAYCEKYPERVERLILVSPVGVPTASPRVEAFRLNATFRQRLFISLYISLFERGTTPCSVLRSLTQQRARGYVESYVKNRLPAITDPEEQDAVSDYLYYNCVLPGSGEYCINRVLNPDVLAKKPLVNRIPQLKIPHVSFLYGASDWMDYSGGLDTQSACEARHRTGESAPKVDVYSVQDAGHLLMLDNWAEFNAGLVLSAGGGHMLSKDVQLPMKLSPRIMGTLPAGVTVMSRESVHTSNRAVQQ